MVKSAPLKCNWGASLSTTRWLHYVQLTGLNLLKFYTRYLSDPNIALLLNRLGKKTAKGHAWNQSRVRTFRNDHHIAPYQLKEHRQRGELMVFEAAK